MIDSTFTSSLQASQPEFRDACQYLRSKGVTVRYFGYQLWKVSGYNKPCILVKSSEVIKLVARIKEINQE